LDVLDLPFPISMSKEKSQGKKMLEGSPGFRLSSSIFLVLVLEDEGLDVTNCGFQSWHGDPQIEVPLGC
jgi:hypothetical protein